MDEFEQVNSTECTLIASIIDLGLNENTLAVTSQVVPDDFLDDRNKEIYKVIASLIKKNQPIDLVSVINELRNLKTLDIAGGEKYIEYITSKYITSSSLKSSIRAVLDRSLLHKYAHKLKLIADDCYSKPIEDVSDFIAKTETEILEITKRRRILDYATMEEVTSDVITHLVTLSEDRKNRDPSIPSYVEGIPTGFDKLDDITLGWKKGDYVVVGARPNVGKTAFALNLALNVCKKGIPVFFFSLEMDSTHIGQRILSHLSQLPISDIVSFDMLKDSTNRSIQVDVHGDANIQHKVNKFNLAVQELNNMKFYLDYSSGIPIMDVVSKIRKLKNQVPNLGLVVIDYLTLIRAPQFSKDNREQVVAEISRQLQGLSRELQMPIIALTQVNRDADKSANHKPQMSDIRESGSIEQDADIVIMLYRKDYYQDENKQNEENPNRNQDLSDVEAIIRKNRNGSTGTVHFVLNRPIFTFNLVADKFQEEK